jgi:hypothetical protein
VYSGGRNSGPAWDVGVRLEEQPGHAGLRVLGDPGVRTSTSASSTSLHPASKPERRCPAKPRARARSGLRSAVPRR